MRPCPISIGLRARGSFSIRRRPWRRSRLPAHCSLFTGLFPPGHGVRDNGDPTALDGHTTLAEILRAQGFRTAAFVGSVVLDADRGLSQGFDTYGGVVDRPGPARARSPRRRPADEVVDDAIRWIDQVGDCRFFFWAHLYDPHRPYDPPSLSDRGTPIRISAKLPSPTRRSGGCWTRWIGEAPGSDHCDRRGRSRRVAGRPRRARSRNLRLRERAAHSAIIRAPIVPPRRIRDVVRLVDVMPTVLDLLDVPRPPGRRHHLAGCCTGARHSISRRIPSRSIRCGSDGARFARCAPAVTSWSTRRVLSCMTSIVILSRSGTSTRSDGNSGERSRSVLPGSSTGSQRGLPTAAPIHYRPPSCGNASQRSATSGLAHPHAPSDHHDLPDPKDCIGVLQHISNSLVRADGTGLMASSDGTTEGQSAPARLSPPELPASGQKSDTCSEGSREAFSLNKPTATDPAGDPAASADHRVRHYGRTQRANIPARSWVHVFASYSLATAALRRDGSTPTSSTTSARLKSSASRDLCEGTANGSDMRATMDGGLVYWVAPTLGATWWCRAKDHIVTLRRLARSGW